MSRSVSKYGTNPEPTSRHIGGGLGQKPNVKPETIVKYAVIATARAKQKEAADELPRRKKRTYRHRRADRIREEE